MVDCGFIQWRRWHDVTGSDFDVIGRGYVDVGRSAKPRGVATGDDCQ
jgi:hypothetical protein